MAELSKGMQRRCEDFGTHSKRAEALAHAVIAEMVEEGSASVVKEAADPIYTNAVKVLASVARGVVEDYENESALTDKPLSGSITDLRAALAQFDLAFGT